MNGAKRKFLAVAATGLTAVVTLAGCGPSAGSTSNSGSSGSSSTKQENITFAWWTTPARTKMTEQAIALFEKKYPNIHVTEEYVPWSGYWSKLSTQAAGGSLPDVMQMDASYLNQYASNGSLMDLSNSSIDTSGLGADTVKLGDVNGKLYAVPVAVNVFMEVENPAILKQAGINFDPNKNYAWDEFANILIQIHRNLPNVYGSTDDIWQGAPLAYWARSHGESMYSADGKSIGMSEKTLSAWFAYWLNLQDKGGVEPAQANASWNHTDASANPFVKGQSAFTYVSLGGDTTFNKLMGGAPFNRVLFPDWDQPSKPYILHPAMYWTVSSKTQYPDAAEKLVNFLENDPQVSKIFGNDRGVTANLKNRQADATALGGFVQGQDEFMDKAQKVSSVAPLDPANAGPVVGASNGGLLQQIAQEVTFKKLTPDQAAQQFIQQANQILSQNN